MIQTIIISVIVLVILAIVIFVCMGIKKQRDYDKANLGKVRVRTNGEDYIIEQYGMCGNYIDSWARFNRECEMEFFRDQMTSGDHWVIPYYGWRSLNKDGNASMLGFGDTGTNDYIILNKDLIPEIKSIALKNFEEAKRERDYRNKKWIEIDTDPG